MSLTIPEPLTANCRRTPQGTEWLGRLPQVLREVVSRWSLEVEGPYDGEDVTASWVAPVRLPDGRSAVLKVGMPHMEAEHELHGLRFWNGDPTVFLFDADEGLNAMLLERCRPGTSLRTLLESDQDIVIAALLRRSWRTPDRPNPFRPLSSMLSAWSKEAQRDQEVWPDPGLVREGLRLFRELPNTAPRHVLLATDLHAGNVLRAEREPWLAIDPKPFVGDPAYDATQHLFNCMERLRSDPLGTISRFAGLLGLEPERVRLWMFARAAAAPRDDWGSDGWWSLARSLAY